MDQVKNEIIAKIDGLWNDILEYEPYIIAGIASTGGVLLLTLILIIILMIMQCVLMSKVKKVLKFQRMLETEMYQATNPRYTPAGAIQNRFQKADLKIPHAFSNAGYVEPNTNDGFYSNSNSQNRPQQSNQNSPIIPNSADLY